MTTDDPAGPSHLPVADRPEVRTTYEIRPDGPVSVRLDVRDPEDPQHGWSRVKRWRGTHTYRRGSMLKRRIFRENAEADIMIVRFLRYRSPLHRAVRDIHLGM